MVGSWHRPIAGFEHGEGISALRVQALRAIGDACSSIFTRRISPLMYIYSPELAKEITNLHACKKSHQLNITMAQILLKNTHPDPYESHLTHWSSSHHTLVCLTYRQLP